MAPTSFLWAIGLVTILLHQVDALDCQNQSSGCNSTFGNGTCPSCNATDDSVCSLDDLFKVNSTEVDSFCAIEDWNKAIFIEYNGVCLLEDVFSLVSGMLEYTDDICPLADGVFSEVHEHTEATCPFQDVFSSEDDCPFQGASFTFEEVEESDDHCWAGNYFDADSNSCKPTLPDPKFISVNPSVGYCRKENQLINVYVQNFPAFNREDISVRVSLAGKPFLPMISTRVLDSKISGNIYQNEANITLSPLAPSNDYRGKATFEITVEWKETSKKFEFDFVFEPYFIGAPTIKQHTPSFVYQGQIYTVLVKLSNFMPIQQISNDDVRAWGYNFRLNLTNVEIFQSTFDETSLQIDLGKMRALGNYYIEICTIDSESIRYCAKTANLSVENPPAPTILTSTVYPKAVSAGDLSVKLQFLAQYLSPLTNWSDLNVTLGLRSGSSVLRLEIENVKSMSDEDPCQETYCALDQITVRLPPGGNPDGVSTEGMYVIYVELYKTLIGQLTFKYLSATAPAIRYISSSSVLLPVDSTTEPITIILRNFPVLSCNASCHSQLEQTTVAKFGTVVANFSVKSLRDQPLTLELVVPANDKAERVPVVIESTMYGMKINVSFDFEFTAPPAAVYPLDGVTLGGTEVTITAIGWGDLGNVSSGSSLSESKIKVLLGGKQATVKSISEVKSHPYFMVRAVMLTPPKSDNLSGTVQGNISLTDFESAYSLFEWQYFAMPEISGANPSNATVGGFTGTAEGNTTVLSLKGFPRVRLLSSLNVVFRVQGTSTDLNSTILSFSSSRNLLTLTVFVPSLSIARNSTATIRISYTDPNPAFSIRTATLDSFQFFVPRTEVMRVRWCAACNKGASCIVNGRCADRATPLNNQAGLMEAGVLVVMFRNFYIEESDLAIFFGKELQYNQSFSRILPFTDKFGQYATAVAEFDLPALSQLDCKLKPSINSTLFTSMLDGFLCLNTNITIACAGDNNSGIPCASPSDAPFDFIARISGLSFDSLLNKTLQVDFGGSSGSVLNVSNTVQNIIDVGIRAPLFNSFSGSSAAVVMVIQSQDRSVLVSTPWEFWKSPSIVRVHFNTLGTQIAVRFDQATDRGGLAFACEDLLANETKSILGEQFVCMWADDKSMTITLGRKASAQVEDKLTVLGQKIKSKNRISSSMPENSISISRPEIVQIPRIQVQGPTTIDPCSSLTIYALGISPRALSFSWSCSNDDNLNRFLGTLRPSVSTLALGSGTRDMAMLDKTYVISVVATDFMGSTSEPATIRVLKKSSAAPQFMFSPPLHEIFRNQPVLITGDAEFSECSTSKPVMKYTWRKTSGPSLPQALSGRVEKASGPQLFLPANSLQAGETYVFAVTVSMGEDITKSSESTVTVSVGYQPVVAKISGGGNFLFSTVSKWQLDAQSSVDLDDAKESLSYKWSCFLSDVNVMKPCTDANGTMLVLKNEALLRIDSNTLAETRETPYLFSVSVQDAAMRKPPNSAAVTVSISSSPVIPVVLRLRSASGFRGTNVVVNSDESAVFYGKCDFTPGSRSRSISWNIQPRKTELQDLLDAWNGSPFFIVEAESKVFQAGQRYSITATCSETVADGTALIGNGSIAIDTNEPPSGGFCQACLLGSTACKTSGRPIVDQFRISCMNWADQDNPLQYRFGFSTEDEDEDILWTAYRSSSFVDVVFPSGSIKIFAQVQDSLGESSPIISITENAGLQIGTSLSRRLLASGIDWAAALRQIEEEAAKQNSKGMNSLIGSMALQISVESDTNVLDREASKNLTHSLLHGAEQALSYAVKSTDNVCESFGVVQKVASNPEFLGVWSAINASSIVKVGVDDRSIINNLDRDCTSSALDIFNNIRSALRNMSQEGSLLWEEKLFLDTEQNATSSLVQLFSSSLSPADTPLENRKSVTFNRISRMDEARLGREISFSVDEYVPRTNASAVSFSLPQELISRLNITTDGLNIHASASSYAPASSGLLIRSPVVGLTLSLPDNAGSIPVSGLSAAINISIPFQAMPEAAWANFSQQVQCMFWDSARKIYSTDGVQVSNVTKTNVVCQSSHLTDFVLNQNLSIDIVSPKTESTTSQKLTTVAGTQDLSFQAMLQVVGNKSAAFAMAKMPWQPRNISLIQSNQALALALRSAGGFGVPCTDSVPFLAFPGLVLSTVRGTIYPSGFAMEVETMRPSLQNRTLVSAITKFSTVLGSNSGSPQIEISGFPLSQNRRSTACMIGTEWRYKQLGLDDFIACTCAANNVCHDHTACVIEPSSGGRWAVAEVSTGLCIMSREIPSTSDQPLALGLGLGLGLGLPLTAVSAYALYYLFYQNKQNKIAGPTSEQPSVQPTSLQVEIVQQGPRSAVSSSEQVLPGQKGRA